MNPKVSVIIANYNSEKFISDAISSILNQTYKDFELIIVDDKSTDNSLLIIDKLVQQDSRIKVIALSKNSGVTYSRQVGLDNAIGKYIAILDSDDISLPNRLEEQVSYLEENSDVVLVASDYYVITEKGEIKKKKKVHKNKAAIKWYLTFGNCFAHSTITFRLSEAKELGGYDQNIKRGLDMELSSKLLTKGNAGAIPKPLSYWRTYSKSMTKSVDKFELQKNYISSVQNSISFHLNKKISFDTASAVYYNYKKPANNINSFFNALDLIRNAYDLYTEKFEKSDLEYIERATLKHLLRIYERNNNQSWWQNAEKRWLETFKQTRSERNFYSLVVKNYKRLSTRNIKNLISFKVRGKL